MPMVAVYLLGHRVGDIKEPVFYVNHGTFNYNGEMVKEGIPNPFIESLIHDSIIVQLPLLRNLVNGRLATVMSVFDQSLKAKDNDQILNVDESSYDGDKDMEYIVHRLTSAAADVELRQNMNVEDVYFSAIENRDTEILLQKKMLEEQNDTIRTMATALRNTGMSIEAIASATGKSVLQIREYLGEE